MRDFWGSWRWEREGGWWLESGEDKRKLLEFLVGESVVEMMAVSQVGSVCMTCNVKPMCIAMEHI